MPVFEHRHKEKRELAVKQCRANGVATGETVSRPTAEWIDKERALAMDLELQQFVQQHSTRNSNDQRSHRRPGAFPEQKQNRQTQNETDPFA